MKLKYVLTLTPVFLAGAWMLHSLMDRDATIHVYEVPKEERPSVSVAASGPIWTAPDHWEERPPSGMRIGSFTVKGAGGLEADVSVIMLEGPAGGLVPNVNRWRGQIGLGPQTAEEIERAVRRLDIGENESILVDLAGGDQSITAVVLTHKGRTFFFKMTGPTPLIESEKDGFLSFLRTIRFDDGA